MSGLSIAYVNADPGIAADGVKGASIHYREMGQALVRRGHDLVGVTHRRTVRPEVVGFSTVTPPKKRRTSSEVAEVRELGHIFHQHEIHQVLNNAGPFDSIYERYSLFGLGALAYASEHGVPHFVEVNAPLWEEAGRYRDLGLGRLAFGVAHEVLSRADAVFGVSTALCERLVDVGVHPSRLHVLPNGVAPEFFEVCEAPRPVALTDRFLVTFVGSLKAWHGLDFLLGAVASLPKSSRVTLRVVGDGPLRSKVEVAASEWPERFVLEGAVSHHRIPGLLRQSDAVVVPYDKDAPDYFCPLKLLEGLASGVPVLASSVPANSGSVPAGCRVHWFEPGNPVDFRRALEDTRASADATAQARVNQSIMAQHHTWDERAKAVSALMAPTKAAAPERNDDTAYHLLEQVAGP